MNLPTVTYKAYTYLVIASCLLSACHKQESRDNEIIKIEVATGGCFGPCQYTAVSIDSSLTYKYYGGQVLSRTNRPEDKFKIVGYYLGKVNKALWDTLNMKLEQIRYKQLDTSYEHTVDDQSLEFIIHYNNKTKHIRAQAASLPNNVGKVFNWISDSYRNLKLRKTQDTPRFETTIQYPPPPPRTPADITFLHPKVND
ncbi:DUF6438 domain-containing protein [uncultured Mucilaginibacter sp.]|uniref:DUF6438 domain-containing protein n=1 Tax=uncultured Mucilaginibacter sp. TaxID=797541 RepID=UPI0025D14CB9|nr:DUF6438 domain-containing protein [uncultured Mucilaginibacter sp.]